MIREQILTQIKTIFIDVFENENIIIDQNTKATDIDEWDSLTHIQLVVLMEKEFNIRFTTLEIQNWKNIGEIIDCIISK